MDQFGATTEPITWQVALDEAASVLREARMVATRPDEVRALDDLAMSWIEVAREIRERS